MREAKPTTARLRVDLRPTRQVVPRLLTMVTGRSFRIVGCDYRDVSDERARMILEVRGVAHAHLAARIQALPDVFEVVRLDVAERRPVAAPFTVVRAWCSTRVAAGDVLTQAAVTLRRGEDEALTAGEGCGPVEALAAAFDAGVRRLSGDQASRIHVDDVTLTVGEPGAGLSSEVEIALSGRLGDHRVTSRAAAGDVVQAGVMALAELYAKAPHVADATASRTA